MPKKESSPYTSSSTKIHHPHLAIAPKLNGSDLFIVGKAKEFVQHIGPIKLFLEENQQDLSRITSPPGCAVQRRLERYTSMVSSRHNNVHASIDLPNVQKKGGHRWFPFLLGCWVPCMFGVEVSQNHISHVGSAIPRFG